jgi:hypothetical protein
MKKLLIIGSIGLMALVVGTSAKPKMDRRIPLSTVRLDGAAHSLLETYLGRESRPA